MNCCHCLWNMWTSLKCFSFSE